MERSFERVVSCKITPGKQKQLESAFGLLAAHYAAVLSAWRELTPQQRVETLARSPLLSALVELARPIWEERQWPR